MLRYKSARGTSSPRKLSICSIRITSHILRVYCSPVSRQSASALVVERVLGISQIKDDTGVGLSTTTVLKLLAKVNSPVEAQAAILIDIDVQSLEVSGSIDDANLAGLDEIIGDDKVLLVRSHLDVVRSDGGVVLVGVVQALDVVQIADVEGGDVVGRGEGQVEEAAILADVGAGEKGRSVAATHRLARM